MIRGYYSAGNNMRIISSQSNLMVGKLNKLNPFTYECIESYCMIRIGRRFFHINDQILYAILSGCPCTETFHTDKYEIDIKPSFCLPSVSCITIYDIDGNYIASASYDREAECLHR